MSKLSFIVFLISGILFSIAELKAQTITYAQENVFKAPGYNCSYAVKQQDTLFVQSSVIDKGSNTFFIDTLLREENGDYLSHKLKACQIGNTIYFYPNKDTVFYGKYFCFTLMRKKNKLQYPKPFHLISNKDFKYYQHLEYGRLYQPTLWNW